jgi:hypothetical protein
LAGGSVRVFIFVGCILFARGFLVSQTQTTGRIAGTVKDTQGAVIAGAEVIIENPATADKRSLVTDTSGSYSILQLAPDNYDVDVRARGFTSVVFHAVAVGLNEMTTINVTLQVARSRVEVTVSDVPPAVRSDARNWRPPLMRAAWRHSRFRRVISCSG